MKDQPDFYRNKATAIGDAKEENPNIRIKVNACPPNVLRVSLEVDSAARCKSEISIFIPIRVFKCS